MHKIRSTLKSHKKAENAHTDKGVMQNADESDNGNDNVTNLKRVEFSEADKN